MPGIQNAAATKKILILLLFAGILAVRISPALIMHGMGKDTHILGPDMDPLLYVEGARWLLGMQYSLGDPPPPSYYPPLNLLQRDAL